jgi:hypothetical protein
MSAQADPPVFPISNATKQDPYLQRSHGSSPELAPKFAPTASSSKAAKPCNNHIGR